MDWLELFSPMQVHWRDKWLAILYHGQYSVLQGLDYSDASKLVMQVCSIENSNVPDHTSGSLPPDVQALIDKYSDVFQQPTSLPSDRACNHTIPLIPGAQPIFIRPYSYPPGLKVEIERQVKDMLDQGLIQPSSSPFSSHVLLVKKKDGTYRFCVDFRQLNAIIAKGKFPILVFDQLMDELARAVDFLPWIFALGSTKSCST